MFFFLIFETLKKLFVTFNSHMKLLQDCVMCYDHKIWLLLIEHKIKDLEYAGGFAIIVDCSL